MKIKLLSLLLVCLSFTSVIAQNDEKAFQIGISGMVKTDLFFDTRQTVTAREGHFLLFPAAKSLDPNGKDLNYKSGLNILPIQSIFTLNASGPDVLGAKSSALIEGDFFGTTNNDVNMLRLRHAFVKLRWEKAELLAGQYWHPVFVTSCYPGTVSFNTGVPIQPFSRAPQLRFSYLPGKFRFTGTILSQRDYASMGPDGTSSKYLRDSGLPEFQISSEWNNSKLFLGSVMGYKKLVPQLKTGKGYSTSESVSGFNASIYVKQVAKRITFKFEYNYLENGSDYLTLSGFAVRDSIDAEKGMVNYVSVKTMSYWGEIHTNGEKIQAGIFAGYAENLGTGENTQGPYYLMANMPLKSVYRLSPRIIFKRGPVVFAAEVEYTSAIYGKPGTEGKISNNSEVHNIRFLTSVMYRF